MSSSRFFRKLRITAMVFDLNGVTVLATKSADPNFITRVVHSNQLNFLMLLLCLWQNFTHGLFLVSLLFCISPRFTQLRFDQPITKTFIN